MKKNNEITFISLLQDENFLKLAKNFSIADPQVFEFMEAHPDRKDTIRYAFEFVKANADQNRSLESDDISGIWGNILVQSEKQRKNQNRFLVNFLRISAVLVVVVAVPFFLYKYTKPSDILEQMAQSKIEAGQDAVIVLSNGSKYNLLSKESRIEYNADGSEVTVEDEKVGQEKLNNSQNEGGESNVNQVVVPFGRRHNIVLSDGTKVHLNSGSRLVFPAEFKGKHREVYLKGEGFFEVTKNKEKPFIVKTDHVDLKVLGTSFNVSSYDDEQMVTTVLVEGKVLVRQNDKLFSGAHVELSPGQGCFYSVATSSSIVKPVDVNDFVSWKDGVFRFKDQPLLDVVKRVQKYYNQTIIIEGSSLPNTVISGKLVLSDEFGNAVTYLSKTLEARCEIKNGNAYIYK